MNKANGITFSHMTKRPDTPIKEMEPWRYVAVWGVAAVSVALFVALGTHMGSRLDMSPPITAMLLPVVPTAIATIVAYCLLTPDNNDVKVYKYPAFVEQERAKERKGAEKPKEEVFENDLYRDSHWFAIKRGKFIDWLSEPVEGGKTGLEKFNEKWGTYTVRDVSEYAQYFMSQRLGGAVATDVLANLYPGWAIMGGARVEVEKGDTDLQKRTKAPNAYIADITDLGRIKIHCHYRFKLLAPGANPLDPKEGQVKYVNTWGIVDSKDDMTRIGIEAAQSEPMPFAL